MGGARRLAGSLGVVSVVFVVAVLASAVLQLAEPVACASWFTWTTEEKHKDIEDYDLINDLLAETVQTDAPLDNLVAVLKWQKQLAGEQAPVGAAASRRLAQLRERDLQGSLIQVTSLLKLMDPDNLDCGPLSANILKKNVAATGSRLMVPDEELGPMRRLESVIRQVAVWHAEQCHHVYPKILKWALKDGSKNSLDDIRRMWNTVIETSRKRIFLDQKRETDPRQVLRMKAQTISLGGQLEAQAMLYYLKNRARDDPDLPYLSRLADPKRRGRWMVVEEKVEELMNKYAFARCEYLMRAFGHILKPAELDQRLSSPKHKYRAINNDHAELIIQMEYHRLCNDLLNVHRNTMQKNVIQVIWQETRSGRR